jgi:hypothetical protein
MPIFVRATPVVKGEKEVYGPYTDDKLLNVVNFARISSKRSKDRKTREVIWVCGKRAPMILRIYHDGIRTFPKGKRGDRTEETFKAMNACMKTAGDACKVGEGTPEQLIKGRKRVIAPACPSKVVATAPKKKSKS